MPYGVKTLVVFLAGLLVAVARAQDYYEDYLEPQVMTVDVEETPTSQVEGSDVDKRAWNSGFNSGMGKRAWNSKLLTNMLIQGVFFFIGKKYKKLIWTGLVYISSCVLYITYIILKSELIKVASIVDWANVHGTVSFYWITCYKLS